MTSIGILLCLAFALTLVFMKLLKPIHRGSIHWILDHDEGGYVWLGHSSVTLIANHRWRLRWDDDNELWYTNHTGVVHHGAWKTIEGAKAECEAEHRRIVQRSLSETTEIVFIERGTTL